MNRRRYIPARAPLLVVVGTFAFRACLAAYPRPFRRAFGGEMVEVFRRASMRAHLERGTIGALGYWMSVFPDLFRTAFAENGQPTNGGDAPRKRGRNMLDDLVQDLRFAVRSMLQSPAFTVAALLTLALGIGANVAIYSLVDAVLLHPVPLRQPERLVAPGNSVVTYPAYRDFRDRTRSFEGLAAWDTRGRRLVVQRGDDVDVVSGVLVSGNYFDVLGVDARVGRLISPADDDEAGGSPVVVISHDLWRRMFAADPDVVGERIVVNGYPLNIVGVAAQGFRGERLYDVKEMWIPLAMHAALTPGGEGDLDSRDAWWIRMMGRLAPGVTPAQALSELNAIGARLAEEYPRTDSEWQFDEMLPAQTIASITRRDELLRFIGLLAATVGAALLIACANVGNLLLLRGEHRRAEIGMRRALGATRSRLIRQLLTESLVLSVLGGMAGIGVASAALAVLGRFQLPGRIDIAALDVGVQPSTLLAALVISMATALFFGTVPALHGARSPGIGTRGGASGRRSSWARGGFVALQVALSLVLLAGGGLFVRSLVNAMSSDVGFDSDGLFVADVNMDGQGLDVARADLFFREVQERLEAVPGIEAVGWSNAVPVETRSYMEDVLVEGFEPAGDQQRVRSIHMNMVSRGFFDAVGIPLVRGRPLDARAGSREVVVNEAFVDRYWPGQRAIGKRVQPAGGDMFEVVGVAADTTLRRLGEEPFPYIFAPLLGVGVLSPRLSVRASTAPAQLADTLRRTVQEVSASVPVTDVRTWSEHTGAQVRTQQLGATLLGFFSIVALTLASVGIYGVISFGVVRRTRELGVRAALGARPEDLVRLAMKGGAAPLIVGVAAGIVLVLAAGRAIAGFLFGVEPYDVATLAVTVGAILLVGLAAAWLPARRATRVDPLTALRAE